MTAGFLGWTACVLIGFMAEHPKPEELASYVEFDFATLPRTVGGAYSFSLTVRTRDKDLSFVEVCSGEKRIDPAGVCELFASSLRDSRFKAEVVDKTKLRVYGRNWNDTLIQATEGIVESKDLSKDELPKVKNPPRRKT